MLCLFTDWLKLLKLNLPELFKTLKSPHNLNNWNKDIPAFVLINGNIARTKGNENIYLPAYAINIANIIAEKIINILINLEIFFADVLANQVRRTYTTTKMISVIKKIFIY